MSKTKIKKTSPVTKKKLSLKKTPVDSDIKIPVVVDAKENSIIKKDFPTEKDLISKSQEHFFEAVGRRKTAVARVRLFTKGEKQFLINGKLHNEYFSILEDQQKAVSSMVKMKCLDKFKVMVIVKGGGRSAQAEAIRHGTARVLVDFNQNFKKRLRKVGYLTRDPRMRERKKFGLKRARRAPQWAKR